MPILTTAGYEHACALSVDGRAACWGYNQFGQLGLGDNTVRIGESEGEMGDNLVDLDLGTDFFVTQLVAGYHHSCALSSEFEVKCWGRSVTLSLSLSF